MQPDALLICACSKRADQDHGPSPKGNHPSICSIAWNGAALQMRVHWQLVLEMYPQLVYQ